MKIVAGPGNGSHNIPDGSTGRSKKQHLLRSIPYAAGSALDAKIPANEARYA